MEKNENKININKTELGSLFDFIRLSSTPYYIRDNNSNFLYANKAGLYFLNIPESVNIEGKADHELPVDWAEFTEAFQKQDRMTEHSGQELNILSTQFYNFKNELEPYFCPKTPLFVSGNCIGTLGSASKVTFFSIPDFINKKKPFVLSSLPPCHHFTKRELQIIFFSLQKMSAKDIARAMNIAYRTVETMLTRIYGKAGVNSSRALFDYCKILGLDKYIPESFLKKGVFFFE